MSSIEDMKNHPNFNIAVEASQKILQLQKPIKKLILLVSLDNETAGGILLQSKTPLPDLTEQAKINILLQTMSLLKIPFKHLEKYGNINPTDINKK